LDARRDEFREKSYKARLGEYGVVAEDVVVEDTLVAVEEADGY